MRRTPAIVLAAIVTITIAAYYAFLIANAAHIIRSHAANERVERVERYGSEATMTELARVDDNSIVLAGTKAKPAVATWTFNHYELAHDLTRAGSCSMTFYLSGVNVHGGARASADVFLNGARVRRIGFGKRQAGGFPYVAGSNVPTGVSIVPIELAPLDRAYAVSAPLDSRYCLVSEWTIRLEVRDAMWTIDHIGLSARFTPAAAPLLGTTAIDAVVAAIVIAIFIACAFALFRSVVAIFGPVMLALGALIAVLAPLTHDQWDFPIWLRFVDLVAFGHANPAAMWFGTPLWAFLPAVFAPVLTASYAMFGNGSQDLTVLLLKGSMALAAISNAVNVATFGPAKLRRLLFTIALASPIALYQLGAGYREVFAGAFVLAGFRLAFDRKLWLAAIAFAAGASVSESLIPLILLPAALALLEQRRRARAFAHAVSLAALPIAFVAVQWLTLFPHDVAKAAISSRVVSYRYGGGSWYQSLNAFGILPSWVGPHSFAVVFALFALLALWPIRNIVLATRTRDATSEATIVRSFVAFVAAFFLSYRGVDPSTWYALFIVAAAYFARYDATNPLPLLLGTVQGIAFYAILGFGDFANWTFLWPHDEGLLGILGRPVDVFVLVGNALTFVIYLSLTTPLRSRTFSAMSPWYVVLFFGAVANATFQFHPLDAILCTCAGLTCAATILLMLDARKRRLGAATTAFDPLTALGFLGIVIATAFFGSSNGAAGLTGAVAIIFGICGGFGMADIALILGACLLLSVVRGFGYFSIGGWCVLSIAGVVAIYRASKLSRGFVAMKT